MPLTRLGWAATIGPTGVPLSSSQHLVTELLRAWRDGDLDARDRAMALVYRELRARALAYLRHERVGHSLQPSGLVHEMYLRMADQDRVAWQNRAQFFGVASQMM